MTSANHESDQSATAGRPEGLRVRPFLPRATRQSEPSVDAGAGPRPDDVYLELGRLTAGLLEAQQVLLDSLERDEPDPDRLRQLFELDHLMAQVRRQADSVCVLAEGSTVRRPEELSLDDVLHAAESSVCDYRRVEIEQPASGRVVAAAAAEVVHLITEVLDLALVTSVGRVLVSSRMVGQVAVIGVRGAEETGEAEPAMDAAPADQTSRPSGLSRSARLRLINRLASRHDVRVDLHPGTDGAIVGSIVLPSTALVETPAVPKRSVVVHATPVRVAVVPLAKAAGAPSVLPRHRRAGPPQGLVRRAV
jgi:hypothetical protein